MAVPFSTGSLAQESGGSTEVPNIGSTTTTAAPRATEVPTTSSRRQDDRCHRCHQPGHWKWDWPQKPSHTRGVNTLESGMKAYFEVTVAGRHSVCLLDSGCEHCMLPYPVGMSKKLISIPLT